MSDASSLSESPSPSSSPSSSSSPLSPPSSSSTSSTEDASLQLQSSVDFLSDRALELFVQFCRLNPREITSNLDVMRRVLDAYRVLP